MQKETGVMLKIMRFAMWKILQQKQPDDYVIATGNQYTVKKFSELVMKKLIKFKWKGKVCPQNVMINLTIV